MYGETRNIYGIFESGLLEGQGTNEMRKLERNTS
jgi:hypothetical protein